ncbi:MAG: Peptidase inactive domain protein [Verrucomicrobiales bacterium]|nr:Peptidase inactive domain protein [Verrucomicrobiales bacterium]
MLAPVSPARLDSAGIPGTADSSASASLEFPLSGASLFTLPNGLEILIQEDHSAPLISAQTWVRTGSITEGALRGSGVSHLVEHMVFQGAGDRGPGELAKAVQDTGGYLNAYTSFDRTVYWIDTLREGLDTALGVLADLTTRATFPETEFEKEKDVIRREIDMGKDDPNRVLSQLMFSTVYREHPFREPVIGHLGLFNAVDRAAAYQYYQERYQPGNMFVVLVGDLRTEEARALVEKHFGHATARFAAPVTMPVEPPQGGRREMHAEFPTEITRMELAWRIPGLLHPDTPALEVLGVLAGTGRTARLHREIRERQGLVHSIGAGAYTPPQGGLCYVSAECDPDKRVAAEAAILAQVERFRTELVPEAEVARARRQFLADQLGSLTTMRGKASDLGGNWHSAHHADFTRSYLAAIDRVTPEDIRRVAATYLVPQGITSVSLNPPGKTAVAAEVKPSAKNPEIIRHVFPNGLTLLVREDARLPMVSMTASLRGGLLAETPETNGAGRLLAAAIVKGTRTRTADAIAEEIENGGGSLGAESGGSSFSVAAHVLQPEWRNGLLLLADVLLHPVFPEEEIERERTRQLAAIRQEEDHPSFVAFRELRRAAYGTHPMSMSRNGTLASVESLDRETLAMLHRSLLAGGNVVLSVFGDVVFEYVRAAVEEAFAALPAGPRVEHQTALTVPAWTPSELNLPSGKRQAFLATAFPTVDIRHPDRVALDLIDEACSDMASRFFERIREQHGLAYSVGTTQILGMSPGLFAFYLSTAPEKLEFAQAELLSEIRNLAENGLTAEELDRARRTWTGKQAMQRQSNAGLGQQCALNELYGLGYDYEDRIMDRVRNLPLQVVNETARRWLGSLEPIISRVSPSLGDGKPPALLPSTAEPRAS